MEQMELFPAPEGAREGAREGAAHRDGSPHPAPLPGTTMVRAAPGRHAWVPRDAAAPPDGYALCRWSRQPDGTYAPVPVGGRYVRLNSEVAETLGFGRGEDRCRYDTILRLGRAGFVDTVRVSPNTWLLDLDSWYRHLAACMEDPERWDEGAEDREAYLKANGLGGWKRFC